ncbi:type 1 glutamine amidotransferase [Haloarchaeobius sp. TZWWS8]|uniref:type 1 glutamine amidotransferase n=1 Tax=Haloarchaeobius sp. TZWWS8 TaxID=3446121 RepID=UPI003EBDBE17
MEVRALNPSNRPMFVYLENEVDPDARYLGESLRSLFDCEVHDVVAEGGPPSLADLGVPDGIIVGGSTAGVYESDDYPWMDEEAAFVRECIDDEIPLLGICFGHQLVNEALGGRVEHHGLDHRLVTADLVADPLFEGVDETLPAVHGDRVVELGDGMEPLAATDEYPFFASRHRDAPVWTTQFHPEFVADLLPRIRADFGWTENELSWDDVTADRVLENFAKLAVRR